MKDIYILRYGEDCVYPQKSKHPIDITPLFGDLDELSTDINAYTSEEELTAAVIKMMNDTYPDEDFTSIEEVEDFLVRQSSNHEIIPIFDAVKISPQAMPENDIKELKGQLIDIVEDYMTKRCVPDKDAVFIKDGDYDKLGEKFIETLKNWGLL